jgi:preprotein translocase subunit SecF
VVTTSGQDSILIQTEPLTTEQARQISDVILQTTGSRSADLSQTEIGASWGKEVAQRSLIGLIVFLVLVVLFIWAYFREWKMSAAALVALFHDMIITVGVYALSGFEVTPATVTGLLTILGFSLYDTVVVFDKVKENTKFAARKHQTYRQAANLAVNQTLVRSINTSIVALLPVGALLYVGVVSLGSGALKDLALALFVGMAAGLYSSVFIATPLAVHLKENEPGVKAGDARAARSSKRKQVDPFADVPAFSEDMPVYDEPTAARSPRGEAGPVDAAAAEEPATPVRAPRYTAGERPASRPVSPSASAKRAQPSRKPRSQRGKK